MRLFDAILDANHRAIAGDNNAGIRPGDFVDELPVVGLTCIDPRLNHFFPGVLGLTDENFIWLRNAGNIITSATGSTMRSVALACAIKGGREIAIIGHTDCRVRHTTVSQLMDRFKELGIERHALPENLAEYFGVFASEQQNVIRCVDLVRQSPLIGPKVSVHGLMVDSATGKLDWIVNGYDVLSRSSAQPPPPLQMPSIGAAANNLIAGLEGELKTADAKIGDLSHKAADWVAQKLPQAPPLAPPAPKRLPDPSPPPVELRRKIPIPPRIEPPSRSPKYRP